MPASGDEQAAAIQPAELARIDPQLDVFAGRLLEVAPRLVAPVELEDILPKRRRNLEVAVIREKVKEGLDLTVADGPAEGLERRSNGLDLLVKLGSLGLACGHRLPLRPDPSALCRGLQLACELARTLGTLVGLLGERTQDHGG